MGSALNRPVLTSRIGCRGCLPVSPHLPACTEVASTIMTARNLDLDSRTTRDQMKLAPQPRGRWADQTGHEGLTLPTLSPLMLVNPRFIRYAGRHDTPGGIESHVPDRRDPMFLTYCGEASPGNLPYPSTTEPPGPAKSQQVCHHRLHIMRYTSHLTISSPWVARHRPQCR